MYTVRDVQDAIRAHNAQAPEPGWNDALNRANRLGPRGLRRILKVYSGITRQRVTLRRFLRDAEEYGVIVVR